MTAVGLQDESDLELGAASKEPPEDMPIVSVDVPMPADTRRLGRPLVIGGILAVAAVLVGLVLAFSGSSTGTLVVSVLNPEGGSMSSVDVSVDGKLRCQSSPCTVEEVESGPHHVTVSAVGQSQAAEQAIDVQPSNTTHLSIRLPTEPSPRPTRVAASTDETRLPARTGAADDDEASPADSDEDTSSHAKKKHARHKQGKSGARRKAKSEAAEEQAPTDAPAPVGGEGGLLVMSEPSGMVYVDGRAYGPSPRQIRLPAGPHTVTVRNPDRGEHSASVTIIHGKTVSVMLNL